MTPKELTTAITELINHRKNIGRLETLGYLPYDIDDSVTITDALGEVWVVGSSKSILTRYVVLFVPLHKSHVQVRYSRITGEVSSCRITNQY